VGMKLSQIRCNLVQILGGQIMEKIE
jgi:hypothetical protein